MLCDWLSQLEHASVAARLFAAARTLQYVGLEMRPTDCKYWTVAGPLEAVSNDTPVAVVPVIDDSTHQERIAQHEKYTLGKCPSY